MTNKKASFTLKNSVFLALLVSLLFVSLVLATITVTTSGGGTSYNPNEDVGFIYNITVNVTGGSQSGNVTLVNVTLPSGFLFIPGSENGTNADGVFTNTSDELVWTNSTPYLINSTSAGTLSYFWFNATASTPGNYNITVQTTNGTGTYWANLTVVINDTTVPEVQTANFSSPLTGGNYSGTLLLNVSVFDNGVMSAVFFNITNSSGVQNATYTASQSGSNWNYTMNTSNFPDGTYNITVWANDSADNSNNTALVYGVIFDNTVPTISSFSCTPSSVSTGGTVTCSCSGSDTGGSGVSSTSYTESPSTSSEGSFTETCTVTDYAGNVANTTDSYTVTGGSGSTTTSGTPTETTWTNTFVQNDKELSEKGPINKALGSKNRIKLKVSGETHYVGVKSLTTSTATVEVSSTPQEATLQIGDERKFDVDGEGSYYDVLVKLNSIANNKANVTIQAINESITTETANEEAQKQEEAAATNNSNGLEGNGTASGGEQSSGGIAWAWIIVILVIVAGGVTWFILAEKGKGKKR